jgi:hypothetical protein
LLFNLVLLALTGALGFAVVRVPRRYRQLAQRGIARPAEFLWRSGLVALLHFAWPLLFLYLTFRVPFLKVIGMFQPDLAYWLGTVAVIVSFKGVAELTMTWRVFDQTRHVPPSLAHGYQT